ncbi:Serine/threonine exchanger SteT [compost metagenome]
MIIVMIFYILTIFGIFILRRKMPNVERPYKAFGYPILPLLYIIFAAVFCVSLLITRISTCGWGVVIMLAGIPVYYLTKQKEPDSVPPN